MIYLDNNATTGIDPRVLEAMLPELSQTPSNPSSAHFFGREAKNRLQAARATIARYLKVSPNEIIFTSGGTESMNLLLHGIDGHILSSNVEHSCVYSALQRKNTTFLPAGLHGAVTPAQIQEAIRPETTLIALSAVNTETGVKTDLHAIAAIASQAKIPFFVDAVGLLGKEEFEIPQGVTGMGFSGHKLHGPKGSGFIFLRSGYPLTPLFHGGDQELGLRPGTQNLAAIIGLAKAVELLENELPQATERMARLRDHLESSLLTQADPVLINGLSPRICNTSNLSFPGLGGEDLLIALDMAGIAVSHGSACSSGALEPSRVLREMGLPPEVARTAIRLSLSRNTTLEEIEKTIGILSQLTKKLRS
ncbi:MAG: cysteine desulfurase [Verrucomicrobia bacterium]|nr:cysteine desulfurase [Verrucomicrobiota bacterium]